MAVRVIKATEVPSGPSSRRPSRLRVAAYCRVSTDSDEQESSYDAQRSHYTAYIAEHPNWTLAGIFADKGISGTQARRRPEFLHMIADCEHGLIDLVITKSISRFARNTLDCLNYIRRLKELGIPVVFEKESINTMEASGEVLITILASLAQQESASISQNVKMGIRYVMQEGRGRVNYTQFLGYTRGPTKGSLIIVPQEADVVRRIFRAYLEGYSPALIASQLQLDGIPTPTGKTQWHASTIASILRNEKYCGDLLLQKYFTQDYLTHKIVRNSGQLPQYFVEDHHEPIVPKEVFRRVQDERLRRSRLRDDPSKLRFGSREALRGRLVCGLCGRSLKRCASADGTVVEWRCCMRAHEIPVGGGSSPADDCELPPVGERAAKGLVARAINEVCGQRDRLYAEFARVRWGELARLDALLSQAEAWENLLKELIHEIRQAGHDGEAEETEESPAEHMLRSAEQRRDRLVAERAEQANREMQLRMLLELAEQLQAGGGAVDTASENAPACYNSEEFYERTQYVVPEGLVSPEGGLAAFDDSLVARHLGRVTLHHDHAEVQFKAGIAFTHPLES